MEGFLIMLIKPLDDGNTATSYQEFSFSIGMDFSNFKMESNNIAGKR
jgi:hypothetical protein